jgi:two-component system, OmpR family, response regulator VicR
MCEAIAVEERVGAESEGARRRVLLVEDDPALRTLLSDYLTLDDYRVLPAADGLQALRLAATTPPDLVLLDLVLPGLDGLEVCRRLRAASAVPILILSGRTQPEDLLLGFDLGADDYVIKPFRPQEVLRRVRALLRRVAATRLPAMLLDDVLHLGDLVIRPGLREVLRAGQTVELSAREFDLLAFLAAHPKQVFARPQLLRAVWHYDVGDLNTVTVHMSRLRHKVELQPGRPRHLRTVRGVGYTFEP